MDTFFSLHFFACDTKRMARTAQTMKKSGAGTKVGRPKAVATARKEKVTTVRRRRAPAGKKQVKEFGSSGRNHIPKATFSKFVKHVVTKRVNDLMRADGFFGDEESVRFSGEAQHRLRAFAYTASAELANAAQRNASLARGKMRINVHDLASAALADKRVLDLVGCSRDLQRHAYKQTDDDELEVPGAFFEKKRSVHKKKKDALLSKKSAGAKRKPKAGRIGSPMDAIDAASA